MPLHRRGCIDEGGPFCAMDAVAFVEHGILGPGVQGLGQGLRGEGGGEEGSGLGFWGFRFGVWGLGFRVSGSGHMGVS